MTKREIAAPWKHPMARNDKRIAAPWKHPMARNDKRKI